MTRSELITVLQNLEQNENPTPEQERILLVDSAVIDAYGQDAWQIRDVIWSDYHECFVIVKSEEIVSYIL